MIIFFVHCLLPFLFLLLVPLGLHSLRMTGWFMVQRSDFSPAKIQGASGVALLSERIGGGQRGWVWLWVGVFPFDGSGCFCFLNGFERERGLAGACFYLSYAQPLWHSCQVRDFPPFFLRQASNSLGLLIFFLWGTGPRKKKRDVFSGEQGDAYP